MIETLKGMFDFIVVDTSGVFDDHALTALDRTDSIVLVGTLDIPALKALKLATGTLDLLNFGRDSWKFVLNRADGKVGLSVGEFESTLGIKADATLVSSREVLAAVNRGEALVQAYPGHANSKAIVDFATTFVPSTPPRSGKKGARRRLRRCTDMSLTDRLAAAQRSRAQHAADRAPVGDRPPPRPRRSRARLDLAAGTGTSLAARTRRPRGRKRTAGTRPVRGREADSCTHAWSRPSAPSCTTRT